MAAREEAAASGQLLIYRPEPGRQVTVRIDGNTVWLTQRLMAELYQVTVPNINQHLASIYSEGELTPEATIKRYLIVQTEGTRSVERSVEHYNLDAIIAVGYRIRSERGTHFRQWATVQLRELLVKGFVMDDERLKAGRSIGQDYFDELLARIRDIRASEQMFYKKIIAIYAETSIDYDAHAEITQTFFKIVQNKLHFAVTGKTAAEIVRQRADAGKPTMGLTTWKNAPNGAIRKADVTIAKNYLTESEIDALNRLVTMFLDYAEDQARKKKPMHMRDWLAKLNDFLRFNERDVLKGSGRISHKEMEQYAHREFEKFEAQRLVVEDAQPGEFDKLLEKSKQIQKSLPTEKTKRGQRKK